MGMSGLCRLRSACSQASCASPMTASGSDVIQRDEMNALVVEGVMKVAEEFLVGLAAIQRRVVLAGHKAHGLDPELTDNLLELGHPCAPHFGIVGGVGQVAGEDDEVRLLIEAVDRR